MSTATPTQRGPAVVLFAAFEPSGDAHAAPAIAALRESCPDLTIMACGGSMMEEAGATLLERTVDDAAMGLGALAKVNSVRRTVRRLAEWSEENPVSVFVPVDSPAANFPVCKVMRRRGARIVHLVAPQLWAWGSHRLPKLKRLTDMVLCLLPFEEEWFRSRSIPARFIGHPKINRKLDIDALDRVASKFPQAAPRLGLFPGSRRQEVVANLPVMIETVRALRSDNPTLQVICASATANLTGLLQEETKQVPELTVVESCTDAVVRWCDVALTVSGTMSLDIARQATPMVGIYRITWPSLLLAKLVLRTEHRLLPNIIADRRIVSEFVPYSGSSAKIVGETKRLIDDAALRQEQSAALASACSLFEGKDPAGEAATAIVEMVAVAMGNRGTGNGSVGERPRGGPDAGVAGGTGGT